MRAVSIGVPQSNYAIVRNISGSLPDWAVMKRPLDFSRLLFSSGYRIGLPPSPSVQHRFGEPYFPRVDLLHFFNSVSSARTPWVTTFEFSIPRWGAVSDARRRKALRWALSESCCRLIGISDAARSSATQEWTALLPGGEAAALLAKTRVLLPPQRILKVGERDHEDGRVRFAFVGGDFFRKGGLEFLRALHRLRSRGRIDWRATVVGRLSSFGDYASRTTSADADEARRLIAEMSDLLTHEDSASSDRVMSVMKQSHFYVFPTLNDTFGYSVLEAQACGSVVISTNVYAVPEVNSEKTGLVIALPLDQRREFHWHPNFEREKMKLVDALEHSLSIAMDMPAARRQQLADAATAQLRARHDPEQHRRELSSIYVAALGPRAQELGVPGASQ
jgi:glycosyltransferase involved in cell wall biosynthesis